MTKKIKELIPDGMGGYMPIYEDVHSVNVLGQDYEIIVKKYNEDEAFERRHIDGYQDGFLKRIVICDLSTYKGWEHEPKECIEVAQKQTLRHEIVHAFFYESGLADSSAFSDSPWAKNEEMIDWFALQGPKIYKAWQEADAL